MNINRKCSLLVNLIELVALIKCFCVCPVGDLVEEDGGDGDPDGDLVEDGNDGDPDEDGGDGDGDGDIYDTSIFHVIQRGHRGHRC